MTDEIEETMGLRELKKQMTRESIAAAALKLTVERGVSEVTIEEIANEAFVSPRTVSNYFATKEEAVLAAATGGPEQVVEDYGNSESTKPPLEAFCELMSNYAREHPDDLRRTAQLSALEDENPTLRPFRVAQEAELMESLSCRVAAKTGMDVEKDLYPSLVATTAISVAVIAMQIWFRSDLPDERLPELIQEAFNIASAGYPHEVAETSDSASADADEAEEA